MARELVSLIRAYLIICPFYTKWTVPSCKLFPRFQRTTPAPSSIAALVVRNRDLGVSVGMATHSRPPTVVAGLGFYSYVRRESCGCPLHGLFMPAKWTIQLRAKKQ